MVNSTIDIIFLIILRFGCAIGAAVFDIVANTVGCSEAVSLEAAKSAGFWVFAAVIPFAVIGLFAKALTIQIFRLNNLFGVDLDGGQSGTLDRVSEYNSIITAHNMNS